VGAKEIPPPAQRGLRAEAQKHLLIRSKQIFVVFEKSSFAVNPGGTFVGDSKRAAKWAPTRISQKVKGSWQKSKR
jgi:hypothetical protein